MQKQKIILIVGVALGIAAVLITKFYLDQQRRTMAEEMKKKVETIKTDLQTNQSSVLVAKEDIPRGVAIDANKLEVKIIPNQFVQPQAVTSLDRISGMVTIAPVSKGEQLTLSKLVFPKQAGMGGGLAEVTPTGKRAITISVDNLATLAGMIKPGDYVDIISIVNVPMQTAQGQQMTQAVIPLFQNVLVLAVGQNIGAPAAPRGEGGRYAPTEEKREASPLITLALTPQEANLIAFIQEQGRIRLILRSPADSQIQLVQPANWDTLFQYLNLMPQQQTPKEAEAAPQQESAAGYVEIYRGLNKEIVPLSQ
jgi:pilus assembly protein CpaB